MKNIWTKIVGYCTSAVVFLRGLGWSRDRWIRVGVWTVFTIIFLIALRSCSGGSVDNGTTTGNGIWILLGGGLIFAAVFSRERPYLAWTFAGFAGLVIIILMGKSSVFFSWGVVGLPVFAAAGIWGWAKTDGRTKSFLGFASGLVILYWLFLFYQGHPVGDTGFIGRVFFPDDTAKAIFLVALAVFLFAIWKRSKVFYVISFIILLSFLGNTMINEVFNRFPERLTPKVSEKTKDTWEKGWDALLNKISGAVSPPAITNPGLSGGANSGGANTASGENKRLLFSVKVLNPPWPQTIPGDLPAGRYEIIFEPAEAEAGAYLSIERPNGTFELRKIQKRTAVKDGERGVGIKTSSVATARIYAR